MGLVPIHRFFLGVAYEECFIPLVCFDHGTAAVLEVPQWSTRKLRMSPSRWTLEMSGSLSAVHVCEPRSTWNIGRFIQPHSTPKNVSREKLGYPQVLSPFCRGLVCNSHTIGQTSMTMVVSRRILWCHKPFHVYGQIYTWIYIWHDMMYKYMTYIYLYIYNIYIYIDL